jgi:hypothetical protein
MSWTNSPFVDDLITSCSIMKDIYDSTNNFVYSPCKVDYAETKLKRIVINNFNYLGGNITIKFVGVTKLDIPISQSLTWTLFNSLANFNVYTGLNLDYEGLPILIIPQTISDDGINTNVNYNNAVVTGANSYLLSFTSNSFTFNPSSNNQLVHTFSYKPNSFYDLKEVLNM